MQEQISHKKNSVEILIANKGFLRTKVTQELKEVSGRLAALIVKNEALSVEKIEAEKHVTQLIISNQELIFQSTEKDALIANMTISKEKEGHIEKLTSELSEITQKLVLYNIEKEVRAAELLIANKELAFQNGEKEARAAELEIVNKELAFQNSEKEARAAELEIANQELAFRNSEKKARAAELLIINEELAFHNREKDKRAIQLTLAHERISITNEARAAELVIANKELAFRNSEKEVRAAELVIANKELEFQNSEKDKRTIELTLAHERIAVVNEEFQIANKGLILQTIEAEKRAIQLSQTNYENTLLNEKVNHMQKLESLGRLTAGIAHDFNNILSCILGYNEINQEAYEDIKDDGLKSAIENNAKQMDIAGKRAVLLIEKMLTYCRQDTTSQKLDVKPTVEVIEEVLMMLRPALTSRITIQTHLEWAVDIQIDAMNLHQILTNLAVNARDSMKERGGIILISLKRVSEANLHCVACAEEILGDFIELSVSDNGTGISPKVIERMFDPFFTTKKRGEGTGLGLSTVSGMVHSSQGHILVESNQSDSGHGTTFRLLFPDDKKPEFGFPKMKRIVKM